MIGTYGTSALKYFMDIKEFAITSDTSIIIREIDTDEDGEIENTFTIYKGLDFPGTVESTLTNVQYIYENDGATKSRVNLVLLYAEVEGEIEFESSTSTKKSDIRIVKTASPVKVSEDEFRYAYELYNPNTTKRFTALPLRARLLLSHPSNRLPQVRSLSSPPPVKSTIRRIRKAISTLRPTPTSSLSTTLI